MKARLGALLLCVPSCLTLGPENGQAAANYTITVSPKPPTGPGVGKIVMAPAGSATVTVTPASAMTITGGSAVFLASGGGVSTSGTASPASPQMTVTCVSGTSTHCSGHTINATIQAAGGGTGPAGSVTSFSVTTVSCSACSFGAASGTTILTLLITATGDFTAKFNVGMTVAFNPASASGAAAVPFTVTAQ
jgi:hypothetical protein